MFEHALLLSQTFDLASGGLLTCLLSVSSYMFDRSYPDMFKACLSMRPCFRRSTLTRRILTCFGMFEHAPLLSQTFGLAFFIYV